MSGAYEEGYAAYRQWLDGRHSSRNPYFGAEAAEEWDEGWNDAAADLAGLLDDGYRPTGRDRVLARFIGGGARHDRG